MGEQDVRSETDSTQLRVFMQRLLDDVRLLEEMLDEGRFETGVTRIGAEQEVFLVDRAHRPSSKGPEILATIDDPHFTTELARFNLECNLDPLPLEGDCLSRLERQLRELLNKAHRAAAEHGVSVLLSGILPTLDKSDLGLDNMAPVPRYHVLAEAVRRLRGREFEFHIKGRDELSFKHDSVMMEACNTSFQVHLQVDPGDFARRYNLAQLMAAPVLAAATHSPLLFGKRLWSETRIALFQQAVDTRGGHSHLRQQQPRVSFGENWIEESVLEIFREDIARFRLLMSREIEGPATAERKGDPPALAALRLHNGTVYRWNRPCYGISDGKPHLRIENRVLPSGPSVLDEVANTALWLGLMVAGCEEYGDVARRMPFDAARENFMNAARGGLKAQLKWFGERPRPAREILLAELVPLARKGLESRGLDAAGLAYLDVVEERIESEQTGSQWLLDSLDALSGQGTQAERMAYLTSELLRHQKEATPAHTWPLAIRLPAGNHVPAQVRNFMSTDLFTVNQDEVLDMVANLMEWKHIRHVPVEDDQQHLVGLVTHRLLLRELTHRYGKNREPVAVKEIMERDVVTVQPNTSALEAVRLLQTHRIGCLPVVEDGCLVGIVTERDFLRFSEKALEPPEETDLPQDSTRQTLESLENAERPVIQKA